MFESGSIKQAVFSSRGIVEISPRRKPGTVFEEKVDQIHNMLSPSRTPDYVIPDFDTNFDSFMYL